MLEKAFTIGKDFFEKEKQKYLNDINGKSIDKKIEYAWKLTQNVMDNYIFNQNIKFLS